MSDGLTDSQISSLIEESKKPPTITNWEQAREAVMGMRVIALDGPVFVLEDERGRRLRVHWDPKPFEMHMGGLTTTVPAKWEIHFRWLED